MNDKYKIANRLLGIDTIPITPKEWNKLSAEEKAERVIKLNEYLKERIGIPYSVSDLKRLAIRYQVPLPTGFDKNHKPIFEGYK